MGRGLRRFASQQPLTGELAREVSNNLRQYLLNPSIGTIGLCGVGGVGKTTIMKNICYELSNTELFDKIIWVTLSRKMKMNLVDYKSIQDEIAMQLGIKLLPDLDIKLRASRICEKLKTFEKSVIIFDDMWKAVLLRYTGIPEPESDRCRKVVLITRISDVCIEMGVEKQINLAPLSDEEAWNLFVSKSGDQVFDSEIESIAREIVYECGGFPIIVVAVGHAMRDEVNVDEWKLALEDLHSSNRKFHEGMAQQFEILLFAYTRLKSDQARKCFLCCAIFPEGYEFESAELILYSMAMDFMNIQGGVLSSRNGGIEILRELNEAHMLEMFMEDEEEWFKMHDLFRELAVSIISAELRFSVKAGIGLKDFKGSGASGISLIKNHIDSLSIVVRSCIKLSILLLRDNPLSNVYDQFFLEMPYLQVLDLSYSGITWLPPSVLRLSHLRVLFLNLCTNLKKIPSLENLRKLEFLNLQGTSIKKLPKGMKGLASLRFLNLSDTERLEHIYAGVISSLSNLEELQMLGSRFCRLKSRKVTNFLKEIRCLEKLSILRLSIIGSEDHLDTILHLQEFSLKSFSVNIYGSKQDYIDDL